MLGRTYSRELGKAAKKKMKCVASILSQDHLMDARCPAIHTVETRRGERKQEKEENGKRIHRVERSYGTFIRAFTLPEEVDESGLKAEFKDGVLMVHLPKTEKPKPQAVEIKVA